MQVRTEVSRNDSDQIFETVSTVEVDEYGRLRIDGHTVLGTFATIHGRGLHTEHGHWYAIAPHDFEHILATFGPVVGQRQAEIRAAAPAATTQPLFKATIGHILSGAARPHKARGKFLYIIRDGSRVLYVGQTTIAIHKRLNQHIKDGASVLGQHFRGDVPQSYAWTVDVLDVIGDLDLAERQVILDLQPTLNIRHMRGGDS